MQKPRPSLRTCSSFSIGRRKTLDLTRSIANLFNRRENRRTSEKHIAAIDVRRRICDVHNAKIFSFEYRSNRVDLKRGIKPTLSASRASRTSLLSVFLEMGVDISMPLHHRQPPCLPLTLLRARIHRLATRSHPNPVF